MVCLPGVRVVPAPAKKDWEGTGALQPSSLSLGVSLKITPFPQIFTQKQTLGSGLGAWQHMAYSCLPSGLSLISPLSVWGGGSEGPEPVCLGPRATGLAGRIVMIDVVEDG